ncbi:MAG: sigma-70 family RNA polymerase sigma factor [Ruminococcaceae bacterium]|nr:sigma-70 family RNA polymerase sigma factor [Oscillospiraceae bacterium]
MYSFGTDEYIERTVRTHSDSMLRAAYSVLHTTADAEDAVQEAFVRLMTRAPDFRDAGHEKAWLLRVTINIARNIRKSKAREALPLDDSMPVAAESSEQQGELLQLVLGLPEKYSTIIHLYYYEGYSIKEIADILRLPSATVGTRLARGRAALRAEIGAQTDLSSEGEKIS